MTLQAKTLVPDFLPATTAAIATARRVPVPTPPLAGAGVTPAERTGPLAETALEAPAGMWGY